MPSQQIASQKSNNTKDIFKNLGIPSLQLEVEHNASNKIAEQVLYELRGSFVLGKQNNRKLRTELKEKPHGYDNYAYYSSHLALRDPNFTYNANQIPGSNLVAARGPEKYTLDAFIKDTVDNKNLPIHDVVALTSCMAYDEMDFQDCYDYILKARTVESDNYRIKINEPHGKFKTSLSGHQVYSEGIVTNELEINFKKDPTKSSKLYVTLFSVEDNFTISLNEDSAKEKMWEIFQKSLTKPLLIHCHSGVGRTGHLILTLEILRDFEKIFSTNHPQIIAAEINARIENMRSVRPGLINTLNQMEMAVRNAITVHEFALKKKYIQADQNQNIPAMQPSELLKKVESSFKLSR